MNKQTILELLKKDVYSVISKGHVYYKKYCNKSIDLCSITNAKSGKCSEDCKFCAQSSRYKSNIQVYNLKNKKQIIEEATSAWDIGAKMFGIVTSGNKISDIDIENISEVISEIKKIGIEPCASLGQLNENQLKTLKSAGLKRYHHNIETSGNYYKKIVTTHSFNDRIEMIKLLKKNGFEVCSGGIIGMGESREDRIDMLFTLKKLNVDSVPINILNPIQGTPLEKIKPVSVTEILKTIAAARIILKDKTIKIAAGRESALKNFQALGFIAGANGMLIGGYLTVKGNKIEDDIQFVNEMNKLLLEE